MPIHMLVTDGARSAGELEGKLRQYIEVEKPQLVALFSIDPPQFIKLLGEAASWLPLLIPATIFLKSYLSRLGELMAEGTYNVLKETLKKPEVRPLADVADALAEAKSKLGNNACIVIGLDTVEGPFGIGMRFGDGDDAITIAAKLAQFVVRAEQIETIMKSEIEEGHSPVNGARIMIEEDGSLTVRWWDRSGSVKYEKKIQ